MASPRRQARRGVYGLMAVAVAATAGVVYWYNSAVKPGRIELTTTPGDATVLVDNVKVGDKSPVSIERPPGPYTLSVTRDGYARNDQNIELKAGQPLSLTVALEPSPDTGFELTSDPPGGLVWLDDAPVKETSGQQARTNFRASRISPGHHVLEIRGENRFKPWRQDVEIEPGAIRKIHALLIPAVGGPGAASPRRSGPPPPAAPGREVRAGDVAGPARFAADADAAAGRAAGRAQTAARPPTTPPPGPGITTPPGRPPFARAGGRQEAQGARGPHRRGERVRRGRRPRRARRRSRRMKSGGGDCSITVNSIPWSEVWIDGKNTTKHTPIVDYKLPCGKHKLAFKRSDMQIDQTESINVRPGQNFKQRYTLATED